MGIEPSESERQPAAFTARGLQRATEYSWRLLIVAAAIAVIVWVLVQLRPLLIGLLFAVFLTAILTPLAGLLRERAGLGRGLAAAASLLLGLVAIGGVWALVVPAFVDQLGELGSSLREGVDEVAAWLVEGPLDLSREDLDGYVDSGIEQLNENSGGIASGLFVGAMLAFEIVAAVLLGTVAAFFMLRDGPQIWSWIVGLFASGARDGLRELGDRSWDVIGGYLRGVTVVAFADATLIGIALVLLDVPAALPLAVLTFFGAYVPFVGAVVVGALAALVALVANGFVVALIVVAVVIAVQQIEGDVLYPIVVGQRVALHPLATLIAITAGAITAGILGAIIAVPLAAIVGQALAYSREQREGAEPRTEAEPASG